MARLSGTWTLRATTNQAGWDQRVRIAGSTNADGAHPMVVGTVIPNVRGVDMEVTTQAFNPVVGRWLDSFQIEMMSWDPAKGVMLTISADDRTDAPDADFNDLIVECVSNDPEIVPPRFDGPRLDLTIPQKYIKEKCHYPEPRPPQEKKGQSE